MYNAKTPILPTKTYEDRLKKLQYLNRLARDHLLDIELRKYDVVIHPLNVRY